MNQQYENRLKKTLAQVYSKRVFTDVKNEMLFAIHVG